MRPLKRELVRYNLEDCMALKRIAELVYTDRRGIRQKRAASQRLPWEGAWLQEPRTSTSRRAERYPRASFALPDLRIRQSVRIFRLST